jgi:hypothetical protein
MASGPTIPVIFKSVVADLDYGLDLSPIPTQREQPWLAAGEAVTQISVSISTAPDSNLVINSSSINTNLSGVPASLLVAWLSGGTLNSVYTVTFQFTTSQGRTDIRSINIQIVPR